MPDRKISIEFHVQDSVILDREQIWPDGDAPDDYTAADVKAVMEASGSKQRVLESWELLQFADIQVWVTVERPRPAQIEQLPLATRSAPAFDSVRVWG